MWGLAVLHEQARMAIAKQWPIWQRPTQLVCARLKSSQEEASIANHGELQELVRYSHRYAHCSPNQWSSSSAQGVHLAASPRPKLLLRPTLMLHLASITACCHCHVIINVIILSRSQLLPAEKCGHMARLRAHPLKQLQCAVCKRTHLRSVPRLCKLHRGTKHHPQAQLHMRRQPQLTLNHPRTRNTTCKH
eukprot:3463006-Amphidinium_carterae.1